MARAADGMIDTATTTYELVPAKGVIKVTIDLSVTNRVPSTSRMVPCTRFEFDPWLGWYPVASTCPQTTNYYITNSYIWLENGARTVKVTADRGTVGRKVDKKSEGFTGYTLTFQAIYRGQTRKIHLTYELPGGKPRSATTLRVGRAYANFCVTANGGDSGSVRVVVPKAFEMTVWPEPMKATASGNRIVYQSGTITETSSFYRCFDGANEAGFVRSEVTSPSGRTVTIEGWPEDKAWRAAVGAEVSDAVEGLEALVGRGLPGTGPITIREVSDSELGGDYAGTFDTETAVARIGELYSQSGLVAHELSHAWFNLDAFEARWMTEGLAQWAERATRAAGAACSQPGAYPGKGAPDLDTWTFVGPKSTDAARALVDYQYDASCWIATALGTRMGDERMTAVVEALLDRRAAYGDEPTDRRPGTGPIDWKTFLDLVDEVGLVPAGVADLEFSQDLLLDYGVAEPNELVGRAKARSAYHELAADLGDWQMPDAIRVPLEAWDFAETRARTTTAKEVLTQVRTADSALAGIDAADGPAKAVFGDATTAADLKEARDIAASQATAAADVAGALEALDEPRDVLAEIGLMGVELQPVADEAVAAVKAADADAAAAGAAMIRDELGRAAGTGTQRVALGVSGVLAALLLLVGGLLLVRRRRHRPLIASLSTSGFEAHAPVPDDVTLPAGDGSLVNSAAETSASLLARSEGEAPTEIPPPDDLAG